MLFGYIGGALGEGGGVLPTPDPPAGQQQLQAEPNQPACGQRHAEHFRLTRHFAEFGSASAQLITDPAPEGKLEWPALLRESPGFLT